VHEENTIDRRIGKRQFEFIHQRDECRSRRRPFDHALCCGHEGKAAFRVLAKQAEVRRRVADAQHPQSGASGPQSANAAADEPPRYRSKRVSIEIAKIDDIHAIIYHEPPRRLPPCH